MEFEREEDFLENVAENLTTKLFDDDTVDRGEYVSGEQLVKVNLPSESKTWYYGERAAERGNLEKIQDFIDPIGYKVDFSKTKSALLGTTSDATIYIVDVSLVQLLAQGNPMGKIPGKHRYEMFTIGDSNMRSELQDGIKEVFSD